MQDNVYQPGSATLGQQPQIGPNQLEIKQSGYGKFDLGQCFQIATDTFKIQWGPAIGIFLVGMLIQMLAYASVYILIGIWLAPIIMAGFQMLGLEMVRGRMTVNTLFRGFEKQGSVWGSSILTGIIYFLPTLPGLLALLIGLILSLNQNVEGGNPPAIFWAGYMTFIVSILAAMPFIFYLRGRFILVLPLVLDRNFGAIDALKESWRVTREQHWMLMLHIFLVHMVSQAGAALCYVGLLASMPFSAAVYGAAQAQLLGEIPSPPIPGAGNLQTSAGGPVGSSNPQDSSGPRSQGFTGQSAEPHNPYDSNPA